MATILHKDGETIRVPARSVQKHIAQGWSPDDPETPKPDLGIVPPHLHVGEIDGDDEESALKAMGIYDRPQVGAMNVPV